jgi:hypothetical protein
VFFRMKQEVFGSRVVENGVMARAMGFGVLDRARGLKYPRIPFIPLFRPLDVSRSLSR